MFLSDPALDLREQHTDVVGLLSDCGVDLEEEVLVVLDGGVIVLQDLKDLEVVDVVQTVVRLLDQLAEDYHVLVSLEGLPQGPQVDIVGRKVVAGPIGTHLVGLEAKSKGFVEEAIHQILQMDVRLRQEEGMEHQRGDKLTDSLIFNLIKKIELRQTMEEKYERLRAPQLSIIPHDIGRHLHSSVTVGYCGLAVGSIVYLRYRRKTPISIKSLLPHAIIAISINEFERYRNIMGIDIQMCNEYKSYQGNTRAVKEQMKRRVSLPDYFRSLNLVTLTKTRQMLRCWPLY